MAKNNPPIRLGRVERVLKFIETSKEFMFETKEEMDAAQKVIDIVRKQLGIGQGQDQDQEGEVERILKRG